MKQILSLFALTTLSACVYSETPYGTYAHIDLPVHSQTTINKTVTINAPAGTTVVYGETPIYKHSNLNCYYDERNRRRCIRHTPYPATRPIHRIDAQSGSITETYESSGYDIQAGYGIQIVK